MALRPLRPQTFNVEPGTIKFSQQGDEGLTDYAFQRPTTPQGQIPDSLRGRTYLRPLLQVQGDNGGPLSLADMENNSRAMDTLDQHFSINPAMKDLEMAQIGAGQSRAEALAQDPLFFERGKNDLEFQRRMFEMDQKARVDRETEEARRGDFGSEMEALERAAQEEAAAARAEGDTAGEQAILEMLKQQRENLNRKFGIGARMGGSGLYQQDQGFR